MSQVIHTLRIRPTTSQASRLQVCFDAAHFAWNVGVEMITRAWTDRRQTIPVSEVGRQIAQIKHTREFSWLREVPSDVVLQTLLALDRAIRASASGQKRFPRVRKDGARNRARYVFRREHIQEARHWLQGRLEIPGIGLMQLANKQLPKCELPRVITVTRHSNTWIASFAESAVVQRNVDINTSGQLPRVGIASVPAQDREVCRVEGVVAVSS
jgi:transposase